MNVLLIMNALSTKKQIIYNGRIINEERIKRLRETFINELSKYEEKEPISFEINPKILKEIIFKIAPGKFGNKKNGLVLAIPKELIPKIDFSNIDFSYVKVSGMDFSDYNGVHIDPSTVYNKDLSSSNFKGVTFTGSFKDARIKNSSFEGSRGAIIEIDKLYKHCNSYIEMLRINLTDTMVVLPKPLSGKKSKAEIYIEDCTYYGEPFEDYIRKVSLKHIDKILSDDELYDRSDKQLKNAFKKTRRKN